MKSHSLLRSLLSRSSRPSSLSNPLVVRPTSLNRQRSTAATTPTRDTTRVPPPSPPQRALLYVPGSNGKMLEKMVGGGTSSSATATTLLVPDVVTLDLEDSVRIEKKAEARQLVARSVRGTFMLLRHGEADVGFAFSKFAELSRWVRAHTQLPSSEN